MDTTMAWLPPCLLLLLLAISTCCQECGRVTNVLSEFPLKRADIKQTWQSEGQCVNWSCPVFGSEQCGSNVDLPQLASRTRWLVVQLWQPIFLSQVSAHTEQGWSVFDAVGAASLPMELLLQPPCRADRQLFESSTGWRRIGGANSTAAGKHSEAVTIIMLNHTESLHWKRLNLGGNWSGSWFERIRIRQSVSDAVVPRRMYSVETVLFSCSVASFHCDLKSAAENVLGRSTAQRVHHMMAHNVFNVSFNLSLERNLNIGSLSCCPATKVGGPFCVRANLVFSNRLLNISVSTAMVSGSSVAVTIALADQSCQTVGSCRVMATKERATEFENQYTSISSVKSADGYTNRKEIKFETPVSKAMLGGLIKCEIHQVDRVDLDILEDYNFRIQAISEPCVTGVDLGSSRQWLEGDVKEVRVTSRECSVWGVIHSCWLQDSGGTWREELQKTAQVKFDSTHKLTVSSWLIARQRDWCVRCRVTQLGVEHSEAQSDRGAQPELIYNLPARVPLISAVAVAAAICISVAIAAAAATFFLAKNCRTTPPEQPGPAVAVGLESAPRQPILSLTALHNRQQMAARQPTEETAYVYEDETLTEVQAIAAAGRLGFGNQSYSTRRDTYVVA